MRRYQQDQSPDDKRIANVNGLHYINSPVPGKVSVWTQIWGATYRVEDKRSMEGHTEAEKRIAAGFANKAREIAYKRKSANGILSHGGIERYLLGTRQDAQALLADLVGPSRVLDRFWIEVRSGYMRNAGSHFRRLLEGVMK